MTSVDLIVTDVPLLPLNAIDQLNVLLIVISPIFTGMITLPLLVKADVAVIVKVGTGVFPSLTIDKPVGQVTSPTSQFTTFSPCKV